MLLRRRVPVRYVEKKTIFLIDEIKIKFVIADALDSVSTLSLKIKFVIVMALAS